MRKIFSEIKVGEFFCFQGTNFLKTSLGYSVNNSTRVSGPNIGVPAGFSAATIVTALDANFSEKKITLADIVPGTKFSIDGKLYIKSDEKHRSKEGNWCVMRLNEVWKILPMELSTPVKVETE